MIVRVSTGRRFLWCASLSFVLTVVTATSAQQERVDPVVAEKLIDLKEFLENPEAELGKRKINVIDNVKPRAKDCFEHPPSRREAQDAMRGVLVRQWFDAEPGPRFTFEQFAMLAEVCPPFADDRAALIDLLARPEAPRGWRDSALRRWLREQRSAAPALPWAARLLASPLSSSNRDRVDRYAFLLDVLAGSTADLNLVRSQFRSAVWDKASVREIAEYVEQLEVLERPRPGGRAGGLIDPSEGLRVRQALATRLQRDIAVTEWPAAAKVLRTLAGAHVDGPYPLLDLAATTLRAQPAARSIPGMGSVVLTLVQSTAAKDGPIAIRSRLQPAGSADWFAWLYQTNVLTSLHRDDPTGRARSASFDELAAFATGTSFLEVAAVAQAWYEDDSKRDGSERVFNKVIKPNAARYPQAVIAPAIRGKYFPAHRAILAIDALSTGDLLGPAWEGVEAPARLDLAIGIYNHLIDPKVGRAAALTRHVGGNAAGERENAGRDDSDAKLLDRIIELAIARFDKPAPFESPDSVLARLDPLAEHLEACRKAGATTRRNRSISDLDERVGTAVRKAIGDLPAAPRSGGVGDSDREAIERFVGSLRLALRLGRLLGRALGPDHDWVESARRGLCERVFGIGKGGEFHDAATIQFRARMLTTLDPVLRSALHQNGGSAEAESFFRDLYVPLARVAGFLKTLRSQNPTDWPHMAWVRAPEVPAGLAKPRLRLLFRQLAVTEDLDADEAVADLTRAELSARGPATSPWSVAPAEWFGGETWRRNAGVRIWRKLLAEKLPSGTKNWLLGPIAEQAVRALGWPADTGPSDPWEFARWTSCIVTAAERQNYPFTDANGTKLPWDSSLAVKNKDRAQPFEIGAAPDGAVGRRVDGRIRLALVRTLLNRHREQAQSAVDHDAHLIQLAEIAELLPNLTDNSLRSAELIECNNVRREIYAALDKAQQAKTSQQLALLREMMHLDVATRFGPPAAPSFKDVVAHIRESRPAEDPIHDGLGDILEEMERLRKEIGLVPGGDLVAVRAGTDAYLELAFPKRLREADQELVQRTFIGRLQALNGNRIAKLLELESNLERLLEHHLATPVINPRETANDLSLLLRAYELIDYTIWYSRGPFNPLEYLRPQQASPEGSWYPALVVLAWGSSLERKALGVIERLGPAGAADVIKLRRAIFQRNEAAMATLNIMLSQPDAAEKLAFRHTQEVRTLNLKLLAESHQRHELSAKELVRGAFDGMLINLKIARLSANPSDEAVSTRLFGRRSPNDGLSRLFEKLGARSRLLETNCVDAVARLAAGCVADQRLPDAIRTGADQFLREGSHGLLHGAETPDRVIELARMMIQHAGLNPGNSRYRKFYDDALTEPASDGEPSLSTDFRAAVAGPFYLRNLNSQKAFVRLELDEWRKTVRAGADENDRRDGLRAERALRRELGPLAVRLACGVEPPQGRLYLWRPADLLDKQLGVLEAPPTAFFDLAAWWRSLARPDDPEPIHRLLRSAGTKDEDALAGIYRRRCEREAMTLTTTLDALDDKLRALVPVAADRSALAAVESAWARGQFVRDEVNRLVECPRRYNRWERDTGQSLGLAVPEGIALKKWEALRPLWLPAANDQLLSEWQEPATDGDAWKEKGGAPAYEFLLLLRRCTDPNNDGAARSWVFANAAADRIGAWTMHAKSRSTSAAWNALRGQYVYAMVPPGPYPGSPPPRIGPVLARLIWTPKSADSEDFAAFVARKDALMCDLLALVAEGGVRGPAVDWFVFGSRAFPPFTALRPESAARSGTVCAMLDRPDSRVKRLFGLLDAHADIETRNRLRDAVFWYQIRAMSGDGRLETPEVGWSGWIPSPSANAVVVQPQGTLRKPVSLASDGNEDTTPENAWRRIIASVVTDLRQPGIADSHDPLVIGVDQPADWVFAFGTDELVRAVSAGIGRAVVPARGSEGIRVVVRRVEAGMSVETELRRDNQKLALARNVPIRGPWPPWFAARVVPRWDDAGFRYCLGIAVIGAMIFGWRLRTCWNDRMRGVRPRAWACVMAFSGLALAAWSSGVVAAGGPRRGGVIEILLGRGPDLSPAARPFVVEGCAGVFRELASETAMTSAGDALDNWPHRWAAVARSLLFSAEAPHSAAYREDERVAGQRYRIVPLERPSQAGPEDEGPIMPGEATAHAFRINAERAITERVFVGPNGYVVPPRGPDTTFRLMFLTGDHVGLDDSRALVSEYTRPADVAVWLPGPTRDASAGRALTASARLRRVAAISRRVVSPVAARGEPEVTALESTRNTFADGSRVDELDRFAERPHDLDVASDQLWANSTEWARKFGRELGSLCVQRLRSGSLEMSESTLRSRASEWEWVFAAAIAAIPALALAQLQRRGRSWRGICRFLAQFGADIVCQLIAVTIVVLTLTAVYSAVAPALTTYGRPVVSMRLGVATAAAAALIPSVSMALALLASRIWPHGSFDPIHDARATKWIAVGWELLQRVAGLVLLGAALACLAAVPVGDGGAGLCVLLPSTPVASTVAAFGIWLLAASCLLAAPAEFANHSKVPGRSRRHMSFRRSL